MFVYGLTRKQCGVIFAAGKNGRINLCDGFNNWMYNRVADAKVFADDSKTADVFAKMKNGLESIFSGNLAEAEAELNAAYDAWHTYFSEN